MAKKRTKPTEPASPAIRDRIKELRRVPASELIPSTKNWRTHPQPQQEALQGVLNEVGYADALIAREREDGALVLIDGHLRKDTTPGAVVPVLVLDVTEAEADKLLACLDPLAAMAGADKDRLDALLRDVHTGSAALQQMLTDLAEKSGVIPGMQTPTPGAGGDEFDTTAALEGECRVKPGELWIIGGKHRLICGDSTDAATVERLMGGEKAALCFTSPPYAQQRDYGKKIEDWDGLMCGVFANLPMTDDGQVLVNLGLVHRDGEWVPYWEGWIEWMRGQGWRRFGWYVWDKKHPLPMQDGGRLLPQHEWIFHFNRSTRPCNKTQQSKTAGAIHDCGIRNATGLQNDIGEFVTQAFRVPGSVVSVAPEDGRLASSPHPAQFPIGFPFAVIPVWTDKTDVVCDPFLGSGTTLIAAHRLNRRCFGMEIEPRYCEVILRRAEAEGLTVERS